MYDAIVDCLDTASRPFYRKRVKNDHFRAGWNEYVSELHLQAREAFKNWVLTGKARYGPEFEQKKLTNAKFKYAVRFIKRNELSMRANSMAKNFQQNHVYEFWKEVKTVSNCKIPLPTSIDGVVGADNIVNLWRKYYGDIFNCVERKEFKAGHVSCDEGMIVTPGEVRYAIDKLAENKACGPDRITAEHLKQASTRITVLLALCFTGFLIHGVLPDSMISVLLVPVIKDKTGKKYLRQKTTGQLHWQV